jgi:hypothetical protein
VRTRDRETLHARDFLQPVHDIRIVVDYQSMCHVIPWTFFEAFIINSGACLKIPYFSPCRPEAMGNIVAVAPEVNPH